MAQDMTVRPLADTDFDLFLIPKDNLQFVNDQLQEAGAHIDALTVDESGMLDAAGQHDAAVGDIDQNTYEANTWLAATQSENLTPTIQYMDSGQAARQYVVDDFVYTTGLSYQHLSYLTDQAPPPSVTQEPAPPGVEPPPDGGLPTTPPAPGPPDIPIDGGGGPAQELQA